ncbi:MULTISPECIES: Hint domain-containing protein [unclassified Leisingera]|uniref:Hint domain-containing protein n=1 Tax=unclassified Leisingera TaxID=2614906 RepID=UPI00057CA33A|nr:MULTISPECIES: Hint domain-containing protein [unclassified Leisingera]KIC15649.1 hemolysin-type calcium-binding protein [Leisingera sp. ANG-DT]KIC30482.1 hemolysin-type calcium-binding protein [Leisingera sp. ANG-S5]
MKTGFRGTFVVSWSQTEIDGLPAAPVDALDVGAAWSWHGDAVRVDGPVDVLRLEMANGEAELRRRAARSVRRLVGAAVQNRTDVDAIEVDEPLMDSSFVVTNGVQSYTVTLIEVGPGQRPLLMFVDELPPRGTDLWVVHHSLGTICTDRPQGESGVICFTPGTLIATPGGPKRVEQLREGEKVQTRDNGAQEILWIGSRRISGARLFVMPRLRPVRLHAGALGIDRPEEELLVSPDHRMLLRGARVQALFNTPEVLVAASDLVNGTTIQPDTSVREITYIHLMLADHQVLWANGVETESFHPSNASLTALSETDRARLFRLQPGLERNPLSYGAHARRNLSASEAAILGHEAA